MMTQSRQLLRYTVLIFLFLKVDLLSAQERKPNFEIEDKIASSLNSVTGLSFAGEDYSQFQSLRQAIGNKRVVLLGEQTHGDGTTFEAKALLAKFLHEQMGFNIIVFESSFYEAFKADEQLRIGRQYREAIPKGIASRWSEVQQTQPLFAYMQEAVNSENPLGIAGIDLLFNEKYFKEKMMDDFGQFLTDNPMLKSQLSSGFLEQIQKFMEEPDFFPAVQVRKEFVDKMSNFIQTLEEKNDAHTWNTPAFWTQVWRNFIVNLQNNWSRQDGSFLREVFFSRRDSMMANNIHWLLKENSKIIIWSSTTHNMRDFDKNLLAQMNWPRKTKFMGEYLEELIGTEEIFHLTFTGYEGAYSDINYDYQKKNFDIPSSESVEALLHQIGPPFCYFLLDRSWNDTYFKASFIFNIEYQSNWSRSIDAVFFTKVMEPSKPMKKH